MIILKKYWLLILILLLASFLRLYKVTSIPPGLTWDEAALGYNAYSILKTGKDEYGKVLPINLKSFGDFKPAFYTYLDVPFVAIFGLNELAVRLPSILAGVGLVLLIYFLVKTLFVNEKLALFCCLMAAISPPAIQFSRVAIESNVALFLNAAAASFFILSFKNKKLLILSAVLFGLAFFTYQSARIFTPIFIIGLIVIYRKELKFDKITKMAASIVIFALMVNYLILLVLGQSSRLSAMNFFAYQRSEDKITEISSEDSLSKDSMAFQFLHGEWFAYTRGLFERYLYHYSPKFLFIDGDYNPRHRVPDLGLLYYFSVILIPIGFVKLLSFKNKATVFIIFWLLLGPLPDVLSRDLISMLRAFNYILPLILLEGMGLYVVMFELRKMNFGIDKLIKTLLILIIIFNFGIYIDRYFVHMPKEYSKGWLYGYHQVIKELNNLNTKSFDKIVFSDYQGQPYIYYLFYTKYDPAKFQKQAVLTQPTIDVGTVRNIDNIEFRHIYWPADRGIKNSLFIGPAEELPDQDIKPYKQYSIDSEIRFLDDQTAFRIVKTEK